MDFNAEFGNQSNLTTIVSSLPDLVEYILATVLHCNLQFSAFPSPTVHISSTESSLKHLDLGGYDSISQPVLWNLSYTHLLLSLLSYTSTAVV